jgi:hypothetical protein
VNKSYVYIACSPIVILKKWSPTKQHVSIRPTYICLLINSFIFINSLMFTKLFISTLNQKCLDVSRWKEHGAESYLKADRRSANKEILCLLWNSKVHYRVDSSVPPVHILSWTHPVHNLPPCLRKIHFNVILPSIPRSSNPVQVFQPKLCTHFSLH